MFWNVHFMNINETRDTFLTTPGLGLPVTEQERLMFWTYQSDSSNWNALYSFSLDYIDSWWNKGKFFNFSRPENLELQELFIGNAEWYIWNLLDWLQQLKYHCTTSVYIYSWQNRGTFLNFAGPQTSEMYKFFMANFEWTGECS
jgi:hypothetical protein